MCLNYDYMLYTRLYNYIMHCVKLVIAEVLKEEPITLLMHFQQRNIHLHVHVHAHYRHAHTYLPLTLIVIHTSFEEQ